MAATNQPGVHYYREMMRVRTFEERVAEMFVRGATAGSMLHLSIGEEAPAVGLAAHMRAHDTFTTHHRGHGIFLARGGDPTRMLAEIAGAETGYCAGKGGSMHIADMALGHLGANAIVGGGIPAVVGAGLSAKHLKTGGVSVAFFGDGALQQGVLYEAMNMAALWSLPVLFVCINNQYGMGTRIDRASASLDFGARARAFGLEAGQADGGDVEAVAEAAGQMMDKARAGQPGLFVVECYRFHGHARMDKSPYRDDAEEVQGRKRDPVVHQRARLTAQGLANAAAIEAIDAEVTTEMDAALDAAMEAGKPGSTEIFSDVYAPDTPAPVSVETRINEALAQ